jgi:sulfate permease, SulP family
MPAVSRFLPRLSDYDLSGWRADLLAGITVAVVALPLALGFGVTSGAGAAAGLYTAIVAGVLAAVFGGSNFQISGPTGAMTVVLLPLVARYGVAALAPVGILAGLILLVLGIARVGRFVRFIPYPVITGFTIGIAVIIFLQQLPGFLGVPNAEGEQILPVTWRVLATVGQVHWTTPALGALTVAVMVAWGRIERFRVFPASMAALLATTVASLTPPFAAVARVSAIPTGLPVPQLPVLAGLEITELVRAAMVIALLAALESLLSAVVADGMTIGERHDPDRELFGQGIANIGSALVGGIPATAALARTAVNVRSGARSRLAAVVHGLVLAAIVIALAPLAARIPLAALAGILMVVAANMVEAHEFREIMRSTKSDAATMLLTLGVTVAFDLILAIEVGLIVAGGLFVTRMAQLFQIDPTTLLGSGDGPAHEDAAAVNAEQRVRADDLVVYRIDGPIFFGAADRFFEELLRVDHGIRAVVLRMRGVPVMDATGATALRSLVDRLARRDILVLVSRLQEQPRQVLERTGILEQITRRGDHLFDSTDDAIAHARLHLAYGDHIAPAQSTVPGNGPDSVTHRPDGAA